MAYAEGNSASMDEQLLCLQEQLARPLDNQIQKLHSKEEGVPCNHQAQSDHQIQDPCKQYVVHEIPKKSIKQLTQEERDYWQQRLPHGFQFYLERLARGVIRNQPENIKEFAAGYLEELLVSRNAELWKLPIESYFAKLYKKRTLQLPWQPKRRHLGISSTEQPSKCATVFPDFVAEENLPISTVMNHSVNSVISAEKKETDFTQDLISTCESNEILIADDCHSALEESLIIQGPNTSQITNSTSFETAEETLSVLVGSEFDKIQEGKKKFIFLQMQSEEEEKKMRNYAMENVFTSSPVDGIEYSDLSLLDKTNGTLEKMALSSAILFNTTINNNKPVYLETKINEPSDQLITQEEASPIKPNDYLITDPKSVTKCQDELQQIVVTDMYIARFSNIDGALHQTKYFLNGVPDQEDFISHKQNSHLRTAELKGDSQTFCCHGNSGNLADNTIEKTMGLWHPLTSPYWETELVNAKGDQNYDNTSHEGNNICFKNYESSQSWGMSESKKNDYTTHEDGIIQIFQSADSSNKQEEDSIGEDIQARFRAESEIYFIPIRSERFLNEMNLENRAAQKHNKFDIQADTKTQSSLDVSSIEMTGTTTAHSNNNSEHHIIPSEHHMIPSEHHMIPSEHHIIPLPKEVFNLPVCVNLEPKGSSSSNISKADMKVNKSLNELVVQGSDTLINQDIKEYDNDIPAEQNSSLQQVENPANVGSNNTLIETKANMVCNHLDEYGKSNMEAAISIAGSYISELKKVAMNIERILDEQNHKNSWKGFFSLDHNKKRKKVGTHEDLNPNENERPNMEPSPVLIEEFSYKVLNMWEDKLIKDSVEYRMGDFVLKIKPMKSMCQDGDARITYEKEARNVCETHPLIEGTKKSNELIYNESLRSLDTLQIPADANNNQFSCRDIVCRNKPFKSDTINIEFTKNLIINQNNNGNFLGAVDSKKIQEQLIFSPESKDCLNYPKETGQGILKPDGSDTFSVTKESKNIWTDHDPSYNSSSNNSETIDMKAKKLYASQEAISWHGQCNYSTNNLIRDQSHEESLLSESGGTKGSLPTSQLTTLHFKRQQSCPSEKDEDKEKYKNRYYQPKAKQVPSNNTHHCNKSVFCKEGMKETGQKEMDQKDRSNESHHQECQKDSSENKKSNMPKTFDGSDKSQSVQKYSKPMTCDEPCEQDSKDTTKHSHAAATYTSNPRGISLQETASKLMAKAKDSKDSKDIKSSAKILEIDITALNVTDYLPKILKKEFPLRLHAFQEEYNLTSTYVPEVIRQITLQSPEENMIVHTIHTRPNPLQPEFRGDFEIASLKKRIYLGEKDGFCPSEGTRQLICETECFSSKDPKTQNLILENGTLKATKATVLTQPAKRKKSTQKIVAKEVVKPIQNVSELTGISKVVSAITKGKDPQSFNKDYIQLVGDVILIGSGKTRNVEQIFGSLQEGDGSNNNSNTSTGFNSQSLHVGDNHFTIESNDNNLNSSKWRSLHLRNITYDNSSNNNITSCGMGSSTTTCNEEPDYICDHFKLVSHDTVTTETGYKVVHTDSNSCHFPSHIEPLTKILSSNVEASNFKFYSLCTRKLKRQLSNVSTQSKDFIRYDSNNNSTAKLSDVDDATLQDIDQIPTEQTPVEPKKAKSSRRSRPNSPNKKSFRGSCPDCDPAKPGDAEIKVFDFQNQVEPTDINVSDIAQTGSSLALRKNLLPQRSLTERSNLKRHKLWNPCNCDPPRPLVVPQYAECGVQLNIGDVCPSTGSQVGDSGLYKTYTGHIIKEDQVAMCECQIKHKHRPLHDFDMQVSAKDICPSSDVQTGSSLLLLEPFEKSTQPVPPIDYNDGKEHTLKGHVLKTNCEYFAPYHCTEQVEAREIETQVTAIEINPCDEVQTGDSLMLTEPFPPVKPTLSDDESGDGDGDVTWADLSIYDMTPEHRSVNAYYKRFDDYPGVDKDYVIYPSQYKPPATTPQIVIQLLEDKVGKMKMTGGDIAPYRIDEDQLSYDGGVKDFVDKENLTKDGKHPSDDYDNYVKEVYKWPEDVRDHEQGEFRNVPRRYESLTITSYAKETVVRGPLRKKYTNFGAGQAFKDMKDEEEEEEEEGRAEGKANGETKGSEGHHPYKRKRRITVGPSVSTQTLNTPSNTLKSGFY